MRKVVRRVGMLMVAAMLALPGGTAFATEQGAVLRVDGTTTEAVGERQVAAARQGETVTITGSKFRFEESVGLWITWPDGRVFGLDAENIRADLGGDWSVSLTLDGSLQTGLHQLSARGKTSGRGAIAPFYLMIGTAGAERSGEMRLVPERARQLESVELYASGFNANENITLWLTRPDGVVVGLGVQRASQNGRIALELDLPGTLPVGRHVFSARGNASNTKATAPFELLAGDGVNASAEVAATLGSFQQRSTIEITGGGFHPRESMTFWLTKPNGAVVGFPDQEATVLGLLNTTLYLSEHLPVGAYKLSVRGNVSGLVQVVQVTLEAGPQHPGQE